LAFERRALREAGFGGQLELDVSTLVAAFDQEPPVDGDGLSVTSGRTALKVAGQAISAERPGRPFLLPAYLCESVVQPFRELGLPVHFYRVGGDLRLDVHDLTAKVRSVRPAAVLFINYFGFPVDAAAAEALRAARSVCRVIEDCASGSLIESAEPPVGTIGDVVLTSFCKYLPVPDGGLLIDRAGLGLPNLPPGESEFLPRRLAALLLRRDRELESVYLELVKSAETALDVHVPHAGASLLSRRLLAALDLGEVMGRRRRNFVALSSSLPSELEPLYAELPPGVSPLTFPVRVPNGRRDALRQALFDRSVYCAVRWPLPSAVDRSEFEDAARLSEEILGFPIDQRYDEEDMAIVAGRATDAWKEVE
jgi:dTDP-4-amino-4,6-dideoxygalactose transaminase